MIAAPFLGSGTYLIDVQNHASSPDPELVEGGQLLVLRIPPGKPVVKSCPIDDGDRWWAVAVVVTQGGAFSCASGVR